MMEQWNRFRTVLCCININTKKLTINRMGSQQRKYTQVQLFTILSGRSVCNLYIYILK
jgi:hypothetical protein